MGQTDKYVEPGTSMINRHHVTLPNYLRSEELFTKNKRVTSLHVYVNRNGGVRGKGMILKISGNEGLSKRPGVRDG